MKALIFLFSIYLLVLSCLPCNDREECKASTVLSTVSATDHNNHQHEPENCTPFCHCSCCATAAVHPAKMAFKSIRPSSLSRPHPVYKVLFSSCTLNAIWQPPKLG